MSGRLLSGRLLSGRLLSGTHVCFVQDEGKINSVVEWSSTDFIMLENQREARLVKQRDCMLSLAA